ncbi:MAG: CPBP family intramembrane metalloprotease [Anaerolineae bacterium]|nr:CPBP family intramembrane metalloprotease [Anaerolineae bacterium]
MDPLSLALLGAAFALVGSVIYLANIAALNPARLPLLRGVLGLITLLLVSVGALSMFSLAADTPELAASAGVGAVAAVAAAAFSVGALNSTGFRADLSRPFGPRYDAESPVHLAALVLTASLFSYTVINLVAGGGVEGLAESIEQGGIAAGETLFQSVLWILSALLGVGLFLRRSPADSLSRLGLRLPRLMDVAVGLGSGLLLYGVVLAMTAVWSMLVSPDWMTEGSSVAAALAASVTSLPEALLLSLPVAIGEEIFFRGALQPVFGLIPTALYFAALHAQYGLTPALLSIFIAGLGFGLLAKRRGTLTAILAHFVFNFVQLALVLLASSLLPAGGM